MRADSTWALCPAAPSSRLKLSQRCCQTASSASASASGAGGAAARSPGAHRPVARARRSRHAAPPAAPRRARSAARSTSRLTVDLGQIAARALAQLARVADVLLGRGSLRPRARSSGPARARAASLSSAWNSRCFSIAASAERWSASACCMSSSHSRTALSCTRGAAVELAQPQRQQLGGQRALLRLELLVAAGGIGLALQVADLLVDLVAQILQRAPDSRAYRPCASRSRGGAPYRATRRRPPR